MKKMKRSDLERNFKNEQIDRKKLNYLIGGDGDGAQGGIGDPWDV